MSLTLQRARLLLDTHALIWFAEGDPRLSQTARDLIEDEEIEKWVSLASVWEMAIKIGIGKLQLNAALDPWLTQNVTQNGFRCVLAGSILSYVAATSPPVVTGLQDSTHSHLIYRTPDLPETKVVQNLVNGYGRF